MGGGHFGAADVSCGFCLPLGGSAITLGTLLPFVLASRDGACPSFSTLGLGLGGLCNTHLSTSARGCNSYRLLSVHVSIVGSHFAFSDSSAILTTDSVLLKLVFRPGARGNTFVPGSARHRGHGTVRRVGNRLTRGHACTGRHLVDRVFGGSICNVSGYNRVDSIRTVANRDLCGT